MKKMHFLSFRQPLQGLISNFAKIKESPWQILLSMLLMLIFIIPSLSPVYASVPEQQKTGQVYLLIVDKLSINDINETATPYLSEIINRGSVGLCSTRTLKGYNTMNTYLTIGAGNLARTNKNGLMGFNNDETVPGHHQIASVFYKNMTSWEPGDSACLLVNLPDILVGMESESVTTVPGAMGQTLADNGYLTGVLGNADNGTDLLRPVVAMGMDASGKVALGDVGDSTRMIPQDSILSYKTNYEYIKKQTAYLSEESDLLIIDLSDLARLENSPASFDKVIQNEKSRILHEIDDFAGWLNAEVDHSRDLLLIVSPSASRLEIANKNNFGPIIASGFGINKGYLTSPATQREYIIANTDIAPTILNFFALQNTDNSMIGRPIMNIEAPQINTLEQAQQLANHTSTTTRIRVPLIKGYVAILIITLLLASIIILKFKKLQYLLQPIIIAMVCFPLVLLFLGLLSLAYDWLYILVAILATIILTALSLLLSKGNGFQAFVVLSIITVLALDIDVLTGTSLIQCSVLGYDPMSGARYYGIGNEYMGILIGATIAAGAAVFEKFKNKWTLTFLALFFFSQCYLIGMPSLGAQSDGVITAPLAFLVSLYLFSEMRLNFIGYLSIAGIIMLTVLGISVYDMNRPPELQSHIGRAAQQIVGGGWQEALTIITRKLQVNIKLIRYTIWSRVFIAILLVLATFIYFPLGAMKNLFTSRPIILKGFVGIVTAALVALIVNDSGIVAASTTSIYLVMPFLLMMNKHQENQL
ncbi:phosphoglyceromutase [hydrocarbon metagenome]|uniref:Phosphoglyceromutase n=1 Tax=hydrocarbon metagenome TaxID=938273 RepID=A0A0W8E8G1_9ZZZZ